MIKQSLFQKHKQIVSVKVNLTETICFSMIENLFVFYILTTFLGHFVSLGIEYIRILLKTLYSFSAAWNIPHLFLYLVENCLIGNHTSFYVFCCCHDSMHLKIEYSNYILIQIMTHVTCWSSLSVVPWSI